MGGADQREAATLCIGNLGRCGRLASGVNGNGKWRLNPNAAKRRERFSRSAGRAAATQNCRCCELLAEREPLFLAAGVGRWAGVWAGAGVSRPPLPDALGW